MFEALGIDPITQAAYNDRVENEPALKYILETILGLLDDTNLENPVSFILNIVANLAYTISRNGLTKIVSNLIAPISEIIRAIKDVLPIEIKIDLRALLEENNDDDDDDEEGSGVFALLMGSEVLNKDDVGLTIDLDCLTLEDIIASLLTKYAPTLDLEIRFKKLAAQAAKTDDNGFIYHDSKVDPKWDISKPDGATPGKNIEGDKADALMSIAEMILTKENIEAILAMVNFDVTTLPEVLMEP